MEFDAPPLRYHGSKFALAERIRNRSPQYRPPSERLAARPAYTHRLIPFAGGLGELFGAHWPTEGVSETVNDLSRKVSDFWKCLADKYNANEFIRLANLTPFSEVTFQQREELYKSLYIPDRALAFYIEQRMSRQGAGSSYATPTTRLRRGMNEQVSAWLSAVDGLPDIVERMRRVEVRRMDAVDFIRVYDHEDAFFYVDPPYVPTTRQSIGQYNCEMNEDDHVQLLETLANIRGKFLLSGYNCQLYEDWRVKYDLRKDLIFCEKVSSKDRDSGVEYLWSNYTNLPPAAPGEWGKCEKRPIQNADDAR